MAGFSDLFKKAQGAGAKGQIQMLSGLKEASKQQRRALERDWWLNLAFFQGEQYVEWSSDTSNIRRIPRQPQAQNLPRPVVNKINHFISQQHSFALANKPVADVQPSTSSMVDVTDAEVALAYCNYVASPEVADLSNVLSEATMWALVAGTQFIKWTWNAERRRPEIYSGTPFEYYPDPYANTFRSARWMIHSKFMDPEQVYDIWGVELKQAGEAPDETRAQLLREMAAAPVLSGVTVDEMWMLPSRRYPEGLFAVWSGQELIVPPGPLPYPHLRAEHTLPFTQLGCIPRPGTMWFDSFVKYLRPPQMELNKYHAQKILGRENMANAKWLIPKESNLSAQPDNSPNQLIRYDAVDGLKPELIQGTLMADNQDGEWLMTEMMNVVGLHEVSQGQVPGRVESAKAIEILKEADASRLKVLLDSIASSIARGHWHVLMLAKKYESDEKMITVYSNEAPATVRHFDKTKIDPGTHFRVSMGTGLAYSRAARADEIMNLWDRGVLQQDPSRVLELLDVPQQLMLAPGAYDTRAAREENYTIAEEGAAVEPHSWDDHEIHLREHNRYRKTREFLLLSADRKSKFEFHCQRHEQLQVDQVAKQAQLEALQQGQPIPPDTPEQETEAPGQAAPKKSPSEEEKPAPSGSPEIVRAEAAKGQV